MDPAAPGWTCARMQLTSLLIISLAQRETHAAPLGAGGSSVAQGKHKFSSLGAPRTFDLFYPELPVLSSAKKFTTEVPVIHLPEIDKSKSHEKTNAEVYLEMFPQDLLDSNKKIKPIDVRIIEHDDFIDYEIEFVELSEEQFNEYESDTTVDEGDDKNSVSKPKSDLTKVEATTQRIATTVPISTSTKVTAATFVDLLRRARRKHRKRVSQENLGYKTSSKNVETIDKNTESTEENVKVDTDDAFDTSVKVLPTASTIPSISKTEPKSVLQETSLRSENKAIITNLVKQRKQISQQSGQNFGDAATIKLLQLDRRFKKIGRSTTLKPAEPTESSTSRNTHIEDKDNKLNNDVKNPAHTQIVAATPIYEILSSTNMPAYQESPRSRQDNEVRVSDTLLLVDDSLLQASAEETSGQEVTSHQEEHHHPRTTEHPETEVTTTLSLIEELKRQLITIAYDLSQEQSTEYMTTSTEEGPLRYELDDFQLSESRSVINLHTASEQLVQSEKPDIPMTDNLSREPDATTTMLITNADDITEPESLFGSQAVTTEISTEAYDSQPERSPKLILSKDALSQIVEDSATYKGPKASQTVTSDEVIKGRYHEIHPGQYHEVNPGQYHEVNPGQYHETNPGQYDEKHPGQDLGVDKITVNFDQEDESRTYNVKANAGDFIIGEVGRIDINSGQTLQGVRYTAVDGEVDQARISDILEQYFGARTS